MDIGGIRSTSLTRSYALRNGVTPHLIAFTIPRWKGNRVHCITESILSALREKPLKVYEVMRRANVANEEACQSLLLKMRDEGLVKFDIHKGRWLIG